MQQFCESSNEMKNSKNDGPSSIESSRVDLAPNRHVLDHTGLHALLNRPGSEPSEAGAGERAVTADFVPGFPRQPEEIEAMSDYVKIEEDLLTCENNVGQGDGSGDPKLETGLPLQNPVSSSSCLDADRFIDIHLLFTLSNAEDNDAWEYLDVNISVTQNYEKDPLDTTPPPENSAQTSQQLCRRAASQGRHLKEVAVRITIKNCRGHDRRRYKFQLFCSLRERPEIVQRMQDIGKYALWNRVEACLFVTYPEAKQSIQPLVLEIPRVIFINRMLSEEPYFFLASFAFDGICVFDVLPNGMLLHSSSHNCPLNAAPAVQIKHETITTVEVSDMIYEPRKTRAGRPYHRVTGQMLMTKAQVEKIIEIRKRWQGLTPRQRRNHVTELDFYCFFTLNRDEAAKILPVCTTWFKDVIRLQGVKVWPGRPLRKSGALLEDLKGQLRSEEAALQYTCSNSAERLEREQKIVQLKSSIHRVLAERVAIVKKYVTQVYFEKYEAANGTQYLDPTWEALPPPF